MAGKSSETPLMRQYNEIKAKYPEALLLFRVGDFYETFGKDAIKTSKILGIVLTKRSNGAAADIELAGFPHHSLETYLPKLVRAGQRVAVCDQLEDPKATKKIVKRGVTELVTPGVTFNDQILESGKNNFLCSIFMGKAIGVSFLDISTGEFLLAQGNEDYVGKLIHSLNPTEVIYPKGTLKKLPHSFISEKHTYALEDWVFGEDYATEILNDHFGTKSLKGFGISNEKEGVIAAGAVFHYLKENQHNRFDHITGISRIAEENYVWMDQFTIRNLELFVSNSPEGKSLFEVVNRTHSPMGGRTLQRWLALPLKDLNEIQRRQSVVDFFVKKNALRDQLGEILSNVHDVERLVSKVSTGKIQPRELLQLKKGIRASVEIKELLIKAKEPILKKYADQINPCDYLQELIDKTLSDDPPTLVQKGGVIKPGIDKTLDEYRKTISNGKDLLQEILEKETKESGIPSLKLAFNNVFGYYLEVRNTHKDKVPADRWVRKQTLVNAERYITEELKALEVKILEAEDKIHQLELKLYQNLIQEASAFLGQIQSNGQVLGVLDCLNGFATLSRESKYAKPGMNDSTTLKIEGGRHPVIEKSLPEGETYVANDILLDREGQQIIMVTGPNMSGKSALLRQTALISILAQMGSHVPVKSAELGIIDRVFVRVGASDNISQGESTFMVEMNETASILNNLSERSLVVLDEIGRGTSTYDGISIAWAISEFLHEHPAKAKTLFATHYHELNEMTNRFARIKNFSVSVKELDKEVIFLRKLIPGGSEHSFGIHVAKMAGMPSFVISKAETVLKKLEESRETNDGKSGKKKDEKLQLSFFNLDDPLLDEIKSELESIDIDTLTPVEALMVLNSMKKKVVDT